MKANSNWVFALAATAMLSASSSFAVQVLTEKEIKNGVVLCHGELRTYVVFDETNILSPSVPWLVTQAEAQKTEFEIDTLVRTYDSVKRELTEKVQAILVQEVKNLRTSAKRKREDQRTRSEQLALERSDFEQTIRCTPAPIELKLESKKGIKL